MLYLCCINITHQTMKTAQHLVIFDGTSNFVESFDYELQEGETVIGHYYDIDQAFNVADKLNEQCIDVVH